MRAFGANASVCRLKRCIGGFREFTMGKNYMNLKTHFEARCQKIFAHNNLDNWYIQDLEYLFEEG